MCDNYFKCVEYRANEIVQKINELINEEEIKMRREVDLEESNIYHDFKQEADDDIRSGHYSRESVEEWLSDQICKLKKWKENEFCDIDRWKSNEVRSLNNWKDDVYSWIRNQSSKCSRIILDMREKKFYESDSDKAYKFDFFEGRISSITPTFFTTEKSGGCRFITFNYNVGYGEYELNESLDLPSPSRSDLSFYDEIE